MFAAAALGYEQRVQVIGGAAAVAAVERVLLLVELGQGGFDECRGGPQQRHNPHPEHGTGAARRDGCHHAHQVSHTDTAGGGDDQRLHAGQAVFGLFVVGHRDADHFREKAERQKPCAHRKIDTRRDQDYHKKGKSQGAAAGQRDLYQISPEQIINGFEHGHHKIPLLIPTL